VTARCRSSLFKNHFDGQHRQWDSVRGRLRWRRAAPDRDHLRHNGVGGSERASAAHDRRDGGRRLVLARARDLERSIASASRSEASFARRSRAPVGSSGAFVLAPPHPTGAAGCRRGRSDRKSRAVARARRGLPPPSFYAGNVTRPAGRSGQYPPPAATSAPHGRRATCEKSGTDRGTGRVTTRLFVGRFPNHAMLERVRGRIRDPSSSPNGASDPMILPHYAKLLGRA